MSKLESIAEWQPRLEIALVISADNRADCPSRAEYNYLDVRVERMQRAVDSHEKGCH